MPQPFQIGSHTISDGSRPFVVAEMSGNHNSSIEMALKIISAAKTCGADAVKIQTYTPDTITLKSSQPGFQIEEGLWRGLDLYSLYQKAHTPFEWHETLFRHAANVGITLFSSPFDETAVELLERLGAPAYKIASPEIVDHHLIKIVAETKKPVIISTGAATFDEISEAVEVARSNGCNKLVVLHCTASYPAPVKDANLTTIMDICKNWDVFTGLSDHTLGVNAPSVATALGAAVIEKHFTLDRSLGGVDASFSIEPNELELLVNNVRECFELLGSPTYQPLASEEAVLKNRRSLYVTSSVKAGEVFTYNNIQSKRPALGLHPRHLEEIIGRRSAMDLDAGTPLNWRVID